MEILGKWLSTPEVSTLIAIISIIIGAMVSYYFYRKPLRISDPCWSRKTDVLIKGRRAIALPKLSISYEGQPVETISSTKFLFWNRGKLAIRRDDISQYDLLRITCSPSTDLLDVIPISVTNVANNLCLDKIDKKTALLTFDYLGKTTAACFRYYIQEHHPTI
jgi:hypothetical protein